MSLLIVPETQRISLSGFWDTTRALKLFVAVNVALVLSCIAAFFSFPTAIIALLYLSASLLSVWAGVLKPVEGIACYFSLSFYTALPVVITGSPFLSSTKDVLLVITVFIYFLTIKYRKKSQQLKSDINQHKPFTKKPSNQLSASIGVVTLLIILAVTVLSILCFRYQNITLFLLGFRAYFFYLLIAVIAYKKLSIHLLPRLMQAILIAALWPSIVSILQVIQIVWSPSWLPSLVLFSEDNANQLFQGETGVGVVQESLELIRTPATLTGVPQFACLNIMVGVALIMLVTLTLTTASNGTKVPYKQWASLLLLAIFFFISTLAGGNRMPVAILLAVGILISFTMALSKQKPKPFFNNALKKKKASRFMIISGFVLITILAITAISVYVISILPDIYMRYIGSIGYQVNVRIEVLTTQITPISQFPLIDQFFGVGPATQSAGARYLNNLNVSHIGGDLHAESQLLQQAVELGIVFFPIYFLPRVILTIWCLRKLALQRSQPYRGYLLPLAISFGVLTVVPYGNFITLDPMNAFYWLIAGLLFRFVCTRQLLRAHPTGTGINFG